MKPHMRQLACGQWRVWTEHSTGRARDPHLAFHRWFIQEYRRMFPHLVERTLVRLMPNTVTADSIRYGWRPPPYRMINRVLSGD